MNQLIDAARSAISAAFEEVTKRAKKRGIGILQTPTGIAFAPIRDGETIDPEEFNQLPKLERERIVRETEGVSKEVQAVMQQAPKRVREARRRVRLLDREIALWAVGSLIEELTQKYEAHEQVVSYLQQVSEDIVENIGLFRTSPEDQSPLQQLFGDRMSTDEPGAIACHPALRRECVRLTTLVPRALPSFSSTTQHFRNS